MPAPLLSHKMCAVAVKGFYPHAAACNLLPRSCFGVSGWMSAKSAHERPKPRERVEIPGLEMITYAKRMHYVPGLAKPVYKGWERDYKDPKFYVSPPVREMPLYKEKPCYIFNQRTNALEGKYSTNVETKQINLEANLFSSLPDRGQAVRVLFLTFVGVK